MKKRIIVCIISTNNIKNKMKMTEEILDVWDVKRPKLLLAQVL